MPTDEFTRGPGLNGVRQDAQRFAVILPQRLFKATPDSCAGYKHPQIGQQRERAVVEKSVVKRAENKPVPYIRRPIGGMPTNMSGFNGDWGVFNANGELTYGASAAVSG